MNIRKLAQELLIHRFDWSIDHRGLNMYEVKGEEQSYVHVKKWNFESKMDARDSAAGVDTWGTFMLNYLCRSHDKVKGHFRSYVKVYLQDSLITCNSAHVATMAIKLG